MPYKKWIREAWQKLEQDFLSGDFKPENEFDIQAHLYHCMLETKPERYKKDKNIILTTEYSRLGIDRRKVDLAILRKRERNKEDMPRLLIEIKETKTDNLNSKQVTKRIRKDIDKLKDVISNICGHKQKPVIVITFFYRGAKEGIHRKIKKELKEVAKRFKEESIIFLYGPKKT
jgi:hypothetical protein